MVKDDSENRLNEGIIFEDLFDLSNIQRLQDEFSNATGAASIITRPDGTPLTKPSNFCRLCIDIIRKTEKGCSNCFKSDAALGKLCLEGPRIETCMSGGLWDAGAGISVGGKHIANWLIGQVRNETQSVEEIRRYAREIGANEDAAAEAFHEVTAMSKERFAKIADFLFTLANQLSAIAYQNARQRKLIVELEKTKDELDKKEENLRTTLKSIGDAVIATDKFGKVTQMNSVAEKLTGWKYEEVKGKLLDEFFNVANAETFEPIIFPIGGGLNSEDFFASGSNALLISKGGNEYRISHSGASIQTESGEIVGFVLVFRNVTREHALQEQLQHSQRMDAIGQLAGGIAHDFNNMLAGILGASELLKAQLPAGGNCHRLNDMITKTAQRAADLTHKLLAFARKQQIASSSIDVHQVISDSILLLQRTIDKRVKVSTDLSAKSAIVIGDPAQLSSVFINLGINAAHAMPEGGEISISTRSSEIDSSYCLTSPFSLNPGKYLEIEVRDTGCGISPENLTRIFEPFYTTKPQGKGTGLGLAAVYGTIQQHQGAIEVFSEPGNGARFCILLPLNKEQRKVGKHLESKLVVGKGLVLVVDDEEIMRVTSKAMLESIGYEVLVGQDGIEGLEIFAQNHARIDLVILDMVMPEMNGKDCFAAMKKIKPEVRVILSSGFSQDQDVEKMKENGLAGFITKPFNGAELSQLIFEVLKKSDS